MSIPVNIVKKIMELGYKLDDHIIDATYALYEPLYKQMAAADAEHVTPHLNLVYGEHPLQTLDVYQPAQVLTGKNPILIYIHGGGFISGDKANHANLGNYFAKQGFLVLCANYRLAPEYIFPTGAVDIALMIQWAKTSAPTYNGDSDNIFLMGHSAGTGHVADYTIGAADTVDAALRGIMLLSGSTFDFSIIASDHIYYKAVQHDPTTHAIINNTARITCPLFVVFAEYEPECIALQNRNFIKKLLNTGFMPYPSLKYALWHNHVSITRSFNTTDENIGKDLVRFMRRYVKNGKM